MKLLQEDNLFLQGLNFALKIKACQRGIVNILMRERRPISNLTELSCHGIFYGKFSSTQTLPTSKFLGKTT